VTDEGFTLGARLLLWGFPLALVVAAVLIYVLEGRGKGDPR
jgi:hypothetical protein